MALSSSDVNAGDDILATDYNNLRADLLRFIDNNDNLRLAATKVLYLDGGTNTYIYESAGDTIRTVCGGYPIATITTAGLSLEATQKLYLDGGGDTYIYEQAANNIRVVTANSACVDFGASLISIAPNRDISLQPTQKLYLDGGNDTYIYEDSGNIFIYSDGVISASFSSIGMSFSVDRYILFATGVAPVPGVVPFRIYGSSADNKLLIDAYSGSWTTRFKFAGDGTGYADNSWTTFSPDIRKDAKYSSKQNITGKDYLDWVLEDANKPVKPYEGIPKVKHDPEDIVEDNNCIFETQQEVDNEILKYSKDIGKIAIGLAKWASEAEQRIQNLEINN